jgi:putative membrane protein
MSAETKKTILRAIVALSVTAALAAVLILWRPQGIYFWIKAFHIIAVMSWMAGMLYLPRLFVYHCEAEIGSRQSETFKVMERRLLRYIINPAMVASWVLGLWLAWDGGFVWHRWFLVKLAAVIGLSAVHGLLAGLVRDFAGDRNTRPQRFFRIINEIPTLLMIVIVVLVTVKPF